MLRRVGWLLMLSLRCWAQEPAPTVSPTPPPTQEALPSQVAVPAEEDDGLEIHGFLQSSYSAGFNRPGDGRNLYHGYDEETDRLRLDILDLDLQYRMDQPDHTGFRVELTTGGSMPRVDAAGGLFRDAYTGYSNTDFDIRQAFVSHTLENGLRVDVGKFASHLGYEIMDGVDGRNPNATRALAFTYSPFTLTGIKVSYPVSETLSLMGLVVLGGDLFQDTNQSLSVGAQVNYHPTEDFSVVANVFQGPEQIRNDFNQRLLLELVASYRISPTFTLGLQAMTGTEQGLAPLGGTANWNSLGFYWLTRFSDQFSLNLRQEWFNDPLGVRIVPGAHVSGLTLTPEYRITEDWVVRMDFRFDSADQAVFDKGGRLVKQQNTFFLGQSYRF
ncbi:porin [bacterium]|nr:porin [bacterium]